MIRLGIVTNPLDPREWEEFEVEDARDFLIRHFPSWPSSARIYDLEGFGDWTRAAALLDPSVLSRRDITPRDEAGIERLGEARGPLLVTVPPADPLTILIGVLAIAVGVAAAFLFMPKIPNLEAQRQQSPNNALAQRTNRPRPNGRIADIFGTVESTPDLLTQPYSVYEANKEVEVAFMIVGRGEYSISRVRDGETALASIAGSSAAIYSPGTNPNSGDPPQLQIGPAIAELVQTVVKLNEVNGQTLRPTNLSNVQGEADIRFVYPDSIESTGGLDFTDYFTTGDTITVLQAAISGSAGVLEISATAKFNSAGEIIFDSVDPSDSFGAGDFITITNAAYAGDDDLGAILYVDLAGTYEIDSVDATTITLVDPDLVNPFWAELVNYPGDETGNIFPTFSTPTATGGLNLNGTYLASSVGAALITLDNPELVNAAWANVADLAGGATDYISPSLSRNTNSWTGPFIVDLDDGEQIVANVVGTSGLYTLSKDKGQQAALAISFELEATPIDANDTPIGAPELFVGTIYGSLTERTTVGQTLIANPSYTGRSSVRMRRTTPTPLEKNFSAIVDEIKWRDCYGLAPVGAIDFGDVTTVMTRTVGTAGALALKERRLNMRVTRKLPERIGGSTFGALVATDDAADIIAAMCLDPFIGRRDASEVDFDSIYDTLDEVEAYFGTELARQFGHTFDDVDVSFEETIQTVAQAAFCQAYRQGRVIRLAFERANDASAMIFNARNILPDTQRRTVRFGVLDDHDGIELDYIEDRDGGSQTLVIPPSSAPISPRSIEVVGVRHDAVAFWHGWRAWNKVQHQNTTVELEATQEAALTIPRDRVLIADLTRPEILQGEAVELDGLILEISDPAALDPFGSWTIFIQHIDGTVEALGVQPADLIDVPTDADPDYFVELSAEPRMDLSLDRLNFARATYMIVPDDDVQTRAFLISEREPNSNFTETVRAVNYSFLYYQHDQLIFWGPMLGIALIDQSPWAHSLAFVGGGSVVADPDRAKSVYLGGGGGSYVNVADLDSLPSYTMMGWVKDATAGALFHTPSQSFGISGPNLQLYQDGDAILAAAPGAGWHHWAATYDEDSELGAILIDGELATEGPLPVNPIEGMGALGELDGRADDLRLYSRALSASEIRAVYLASQTPS